MTQHQNSTEMQRAFAILRAAKHGTPVEQIAPVAPTPKPVPIVAQPAPQAPAGLQTGWRETAEEMVRTSHAAWNAAIAPDAQTNALLDSILAPEVATQPAAVAQVAPEPTIDRNPESNEPDRRCMYWRLRSGQWGVKTIGFVPEVGDVVTVTKRSGATRQESIARLFWSDARSAICAIA